jgi:lipoprotein-anchoring transpeptidase ErfK/SrfK
VLLGTQLVGTLVALQGVSVLAASRWEQRQVTQAEADARAADRTFAAAVAGSLADGTPRDLLDPLVKREAALRDGRPPAGAGIVDRQVVAAARARRDGLRTMIGQVAAVETQVALQLQGQLDAAIKALQADEQPAQGAGVDLADYTSFTSATATQAQAAHTPNAIRQLIAAVAAKDAALQQATAAAIAAQEALAAARSAAQAALGQAQYALSQAQAIPVLKVQDAAAAIAGLSQQLASAGTVAAFQAVTDGANTQAGAINTLLDLRAGSYQILFAAQAHLQRAQQGNVDVSADVAPLQAANQAIDAAGDLAALTAARQQVQAVKNDIDVKYNLAVYGPGKVIVVSIPNQELEALQDGVVLLDTLVTTGRPSLPTPVGSFAVMAKYSPYHMISPWPPGNQYYYPPTWIQYALLWHDGGYFIHDAPWRYHFGPGSDTEFGGTHGCVNVPGASIGWLYGWAEVGTKVDTLAGPF